MLEWKVFWSILGTLVALGGAVIPTLYGVEWWITVIAVSLSSVIIMIAVGPVVESARMFYRLRIGQKSKIKTLIRIAVGTYGLWVSLFIMQHEMLAIWLFILPIIGFTVYGGSKGIEYWFARAKPKEKSKEKPGPVAETPGDRVTITEFYKVLGDVKHPRAKILSQVEIKGNNGERVANQYIIQTPPAGR